MGDHPLRVGLFVTCLVDFFRPAVGLAALRLLEAAGCRVEVPRAQTCCGQPAYNSGDRRSTIALARRVVRAFAGYDYVVGPSGSCAAMLRRHYPALLAEDAEWAAPARALAARSFELTTFLVEVRGLERVQGRHHGRVTYHDSCSGLRELGIKAQPRRLLASVEGLELVEAAETEICCGFGGAFCVKYPEISGRMAADKAADIAATGAPLLLGGDMGCLLHIAGRLKREGRPVAARHVAELLAGMADAPAIGEPG